MKLRNVESTYYRGFTRQLYVIVMFSSTFLKLSFTHTEKRDLLRLPDYFLGENADTTFRTHNSSKKRENTRKPSFVCVYIRMIENGRGNIQKVRRSSAPAGNSFASMYIWVWNCAISYLSGRFHLHSIWYACSASESLHSTRFQIRFELTPTIREIKAVLWVAHWQFRPFPSRKSSYSNFCSKLERLHDHNRELWLCSND